MWGKYFAESSKISISVPSMSSLSKSTDGWMREAKFMVGTWIDVEV